MPKRGYARQTNEACTACPSQIEIPIVSDSVNEIDENFYVVLKNPSSSININNRAEIIIKGSGIVGFVSGTLRASSGATSKRL